MKKEARVSFEFLSLHDTSVLTSAEDVILTSMATDSTIQRDKRNDPKWPVFKRGKSE